MSFSVRHSPCERVMHERKTFGKDSIYICDRGQGLSPRRRRDIVIIDTRGALPEPYFPGHGLIFESGSIFVGLGFLADDICASWPLCFYCQSFPGICPACKRRTYRRAADRLWIKYDHLERHTLFSSAYLNLRALLGQESYLDCRPYDDCGWLLPTVNDYSPAFIALTIGGDSRHLLHFWQWRRRRIRRWRFSRVVVSGRSCV